MSKLGGQSTKMLPMLQDEMQKRRMMKRATTPVARFQTRVFVLYKHQLVYKTKDEKQVSQGISRVLTRKQGITSVLVRKQGISSVLTRKQGISRVLTRKQG